MASEIQRCVDTIGDVLGQPVSLTDVDLNSLLFSPHAEGLIDEVRRDSLLLRTTAPWVRDWFAEYGVGRSSRPVRVEPHPDRETMSRVVLPVQYRGMSLGLLCVLDPERRCTEAVLAGVSELVEELAGLMYDDQADRLDVSRLLHEALTGSATARTRALRALEQTSGLAEDTACVVATMSGTQGPPKTIDQQDEARAGRPAASPAPVLQCLGTSHHVFLLRADTFQLEPLEAQLRRIRRVAEGCCATPVLGLGEPTTLSNASTSYEQARAAMSAAARMENLSDQVAFADLGALRLVATHSDNELENALDPRAQALLGLGDDELLQTLGAYLDNGCDAAATAAQLNVHRGTLYYRLRKAEGAVGFDLSAGADRLTLHLNLLAHQFITSPRRPGHDGPPRLLAV